jgi:photosystem II stability/assembly factor-like uncharacterized protein
MARGKKSRRAQRPAAPPTTEERPGLSPRVLLAGVVLLVFAGLIAYLTLGSGGDEEERAAGAEDLAVPWVDPDGPNPIVGSLDVNPADDSLWLATNTGLFRVPPGADQPRLVTGQLTTDSGSGRISEQLVIRFRGPDDMLGSGHPPAGEALPPALGMIASDDAGRTWTGIGEVGTADFHAIQTSGDVIVAGRYGEPAVSVSGDGGRTFEEAQPPAPLVDLEVDPQNADRWIASTSDELISSDDRGDSWRPVEPVPNARFAWPASDALYRIDPGGPVKVSADGGRSWEDRGDTGGEPQALFAATPRHLYAALIDGTVKESRDGGETWTDRITGG